MTLHELQQHYNFAPDIINIWTARESSALLPIQETAIRERGILEGRDLLVSAPTSSGKTFLAEIAAIHTIFQQGKVLYLVPLKALAEEKYADFTDKYGAFGIDVVISTGDHTESDDAIERGDFQLAIVVFEKAHRLLVRNKHVLNTCGLIVIDEIQMTADVSRGSSLEMLLTAILYMRKTARPQLIALSAVIGDLNGLDAWLNMAVLMSDARPVELREGMLRKDGAFIYRSFLSKEVGSTQFTPFPEHVKFNLKSAEGRREYQYKRLQQIVADLLAKGEQVLIFRKWKWLTRETALRLSRDLQLPSAFQALEALQHMEDSVSKEALFECLRHGVAFHNADLGRDERQAIERAFKADDSRIRVICATSTLAMGMNLPVKTVIIADLEKPDPDAEIFQEMPLTSAEYKNMSGRAGRLKHHDDGRSLIFADTPADEQILWRNYIEGAFPRLASQLADSRLLEETLFLVAAEICASAEELEAFFAMSYAGVLRWQRDESARAAMMARIGDAVAYSVEQGLLLRSEAGRLRVTEIGRICAAQGVSAESMAVLTRFSEALDLAAFEAWELLFVVAHNNELADLHFRLSQEEYESGDYWRAIRERYPDSCEPLLKKSEEFLQNRFETTRRIKMALMLADWVAGTSLQRLEITYSKYFRDKSYSGVIRGLSENAAWMIRLLADIATARHADAALIRRLQRFAKQTLYGVPDDGIEIAALRVAGLTRAMISRLVHAGYSSEEQLLEAELDSLARVIPQEVAFRLQDRVYKKYSRIETRHLVDHKLRLERLGYDAGLLMRLYSAVTLQELRDAITVFFRAPQINLFVRELPQQDERFGSDYAIEQERGALFVRVLPPNQRELDDEQIGNLLAVGLAAQPLAFVVIGRPDFTEATQTKAQQFAAVYGKPLHLCPVYALCERYVQALEGKQAFTFF